MERPTYAARLTRKLLLSERTACFHLEFAIDALDTFSFAPGQFVSAVAVDPAGKQQTRAYSIASAPRANEFALCLNRVEGGFFSNMVCGLEVGQTIQVHGPHGLFLLRSPLTDGIFVATGTGIAPMKGFVEYLFPESGEDRSEGKKFWLVYGTRHETEIYYQHYFEKVAASHANFIYRKTLSRPHEGWEGARGYVQQLVTEIAQQQKVAPGVPYNMHAYVCGLNQMVSATRESLKQLGWERKQIIFERYD